MKNKSRLIFVFVAVIFSQSNALAQWEFGIGMNGMGPVDRFDGSVYKNGIGLFTSVVTSSFLSKANPNKIQAGFYLDYLYAGSKKFDVALTDPVDGKGETTLENYSTSEHLFLRYGYQVSNNVVLFTDFIIGHRTFTSQNTTGLKKSDEAYADDVQRIHRTDTYRHGIGFGVRYGFGRSFGLEVRADYTRGNAATYLNLNTIEETATSIEYESESWPHTDLFVGTLSLNWKLYKPAVTSAAQENTVNRDSYYDDYPNNSTTRTPSRTRHRTRTTEPVKKKTVKSNKTVEPKKEKKVINW